MEQEKLLSSKIANMHYLSTRGGVQPAKFTDILLAGPAEDGGLYMPEAYPQVDEQTQNKWREILTFDDGYARLAAEVLALFICASDISKEDLLRLAQQAYKTPTFSDSRIVSLDGLNLTYETQKLHLQLAHLATGPTASFKDIGMQMLGQIFEYELERRGENLTILAATAGNTGASAEYAMLGKERVRMVMLTAANKITGFQKAQIYSVDSPRIVNAAIEGDFDSCQDLVKAVLADIDFKKKHHVGAINSFNMARILAQVVYHVAICLTASKNGQKVNLVIPSGNFGNAMAAYIAKRMGLPIGKIVIATNENDVLDEFFKTGVYKLRDREKLVSTSSYSMDVSQVVNLERLIFDALDRDPAKVRELFDQLKETGQIDISDTPAWKFINEQMEFLSGHCLEQNRLETIAKVRSQTGILIDPHTADGVYVAQYLAFGQKLQSRENLENTVENQNGAGGAIADENSEFLDGAAAVVDPLAGITVCLETALPVKSAPVILAATGQYPQIPQRFDGIEDLPRKVTPVANSVEEIKKLVASSFFPAPPKSKNDSQRKILQPGRLLALSGFLAALICLIGISLIYSVGTEDGFSGFILTLTAAIGAWVVAGAAIGPAAKLRKTGELTFNKRNWLRKITIFCSFTFAGILLVEAIDFLIVNPGAWVSIVGLFLVCLQLPAVLYLYVRNRG